MKDYIELLNKRMNDSATLHAELHPPTGFMFHPYQPMVDIFNKVCGWDNDKKCSNFFKSPFEINISAEIRKYYLFSDCEKFKSRAADWLNEKNDMWSERYLVAQCLGNESEKEIASNEIYKIANDIYQFGLLPQKSMVLITCGFLNLLDFCDDQNIKQVSKIVLDWLFVVAATMYHKGCFVGPSLKSFETCGPFELQFERFFGFILDKENAPEHVLESIFFTTSSYCPPSVAIKIANNKFNTPTEYVQQIRDNIKIIYYGDNYILGSNLFVKKDAKSFDAIFSKQNGTDRFVINSENGEITQKENRLTWSGTSDFHFSCSTNPTINEDDLLVFQFETSWLAIKMFNLDYEPTEEIKYDFLYLAKRKNKNDVCGFFLIASNGTYDEKELNFSPISKSKLECIINTSPQFIYQKDGAFVVGDQCNKLNDNKITNSIISSFERSPLVIMPKSTKKECKCSKKSPTQEASVLNQQ